MLRLIAFIVTGFWPSNSSLRALGKRLGDLEASHLTLKKKFNTLAGSYYAEFEQPEYTTDAAPAGRVTPPGELALVDLAGSHEEPFPESAFQEAVARSRGRNVGGVTNG